MTVIYFRIVDYFYISLWVDCFHTYVSTSKDCLMNHFSCLRSYHCPPSATHSYQCLIMHLMLKWMSKLSVLSKFESTNRSPPFCGLLPKVLKFQSIYVTTRNLDFVVFFQFVKLIFKTMIVCLNPDTQKHKKKTKSTLW